MLELAQLLVIHRHGERTPVRHSARIESRLPPGQVQVLWRQCFNAPFLAALSQRFDAAIDEHRAPLAPPVVGALRIVQGDDGPEAPPYLHSQRAMLAVAGGDCLPGQLTDRGKLSLVALGESLRSRYPSFVPHVLSPHFNAHNMYIRSTGYIRTIESVQYLLAGLFPFHTRTQGPSTHITIHVHADENMYIDFGCKKLLETVEPFKRAVALRIKSDYERLGTMLKGLYPETAEEVMKKKIAVSGGGGDSGAAGASLNDNDLVQRRLNQLNLREIDAFYDTFKCLQAAPGGQLPHPITQQDLDTLGKVFLEDFAGHIADASLEQVSGKENATLVKRLLMGRFIGDLVGVLDTRVNYLNRVESVVEETKENGPHEMIRRGSGVAAGSVGVIAPEKDEGIRLAVFSGHDTTLAPLLMSFGVFTGIRRAWPKFSSNITIELLKDVKDEASRLKMRAQERSGEVVRSGEEDYYVRVRYNQEAIGLPFCQKKGSHYSGDSTICTFSAFKNAMREITPENYAKECGTRLPNHP